MYRILPIVALLELGSIPASQAQVFTTHSINGSPAAHIRVTLQERPYGLDLTLRNDGGPDAAVVGLYFDDRTAAIAGAQIINGQGVEFVQGGSPPELPEGQTLSPPFQTDLHLTAAAPAPKEGVERGEHLTVKLSLRNGLVLKDFIKEMAFGRLRIGVRAIAGPGAGNMVIRRTQADLAERVSISATEAQALDGSSLGSISDDGQVIAFWSKAPNLVADDTNGRTDVFIRNRSASWTTRVSVSSAGFQANGDSLNAQISAGGRYVVFASDADNLVPGDTNNARDVFIRDRYAYTTQRVSISTAGAQAGGDSDFPRVSADGRFVAFESDAANLVPGDTNGQTDVFVRDLKAGQTIRLSVSSAGAQANGPCFGASLSDNGMSFAFVSAATNLVPGDTNGKPDVFIRDRVTSATTRGSIVSGGAQANGGSPVARISGDGRWIAFTSGASNLVGADTNGADDAFVHDRATKSTWRVSVGAGQANAGSRIAGISAGGRYILFTSLASNLIGGDTNNAGDVFVRDRWEGVTRRVSAGVLGQSASDCAATALSRSGRFAVFNSLAGNLVPGDAGFSDVFIVDWSAK
jgi:Tol biopolymer transport system component